MNSSRDRRLNAIRERHRDDPRIGGKDPRPLQLKIRIAARKGLIRSREDLLDLIESIIATRDVPEGVVVHWIDWKKGTGGKANEGHITDEIAKSLEEFWAGIAHQDAKVLAKRLEASGGKGKGRWSRLA